MKKVILYLLVISTFSCSDDEITIGKDQLSLGIWYYEYQPDPVFNGKSITLTFSNDESYKRDYVFYAPQSPAGIDTTTTVGTWSFADNNIIDLTGFGTCVQPVGGPPCVPPDIDFKIIQLTKELLEVEELNNGTPAGKKQYRNIKQ